MTLDPDARAILEAIRDLGEDLWVYGFERVSDAPLERAVFAFIDKGSPMPPNKTPGRPKLASHLKRTNRVEIALNDAELAWLDAQRIGTERRGTALRRLAFREPAVKP